jgi:uncharacterized peroxidase-related enzyme
MTMPESREPERPISRFPVPDVSTLPPDLVETIRTTTAKSGFTPNVFRAYAWKPDHFRAFFGYYETLMRAPSGLSRAERELIATAVSTENRCLY